MLKVMIFHNRPRPQVLPLPICEKELRRIFIEAIEIAFIHQNERAENFGVGKLMDILDQIIPTACTYGTAYWIYYEPRDTTVQFCVCSRYGTVCHHQVNQVPNQETCSWINGLKPNDFPNFMPDSEPEKFMAPKNIKIHAVLRNNYIDMVMDFCVLNNKNKDKIQNYCMLSIIARYNIVIESKPAQDRMFIFDPSPAVHANYGSLVGDELLKMYKFIYKKLVVNIQSSAKNFTITRLQSYAYMKPSISFPIEVPCLYSTAYTPLTELDHDMINDICKSLLIDVNDRTVTEILRNFIIRSSQECIMRNNQAQRDYRMYS